MKFLAPVLLVLLVGCTRTDIPAPPKQQVNPVYSQTQPNGCEIETYSDLVAQRQVSEILNLKKDIDPNGRCTVNFDLIVDGKTYHLEETEIGWEQIPSLCHYAQQRARKELLLSLPGEYVSKTKVACRHTEDQNG
jgi:hypothetical protein